MCGEQRSRIHPALRLLLLLAVAAVLAQAQTISQLTAFPVGGNPPNIPVTSMTSGIDLVGGGFTLQITGNNFDISNPAFVNWTNISGGPSQILQTVPLSTTLIRVVVPNNLFNPAVIATQSVNVSVTQSSTSGTLPFFVVPPMKGVSQLLPVASLNQPYSAPILTAGTGTPPYSILGSPPPLPPNLAFAASATSITGTPLQTGLFPFQFTLTDFWGGQLAQNLAVFIVGPAGLTNLSPGATPAGTGFLLLTLTGSNYVLPQNFGSSPVVPGSTIQWTVGNTTTPLLTAFLDNTHLTTLVPANLMVAPGTATVTVLQPDGTVSPGAIFSILAPAISLLNPSSAPAGTAGLAVAVSGANFLTTNNVGGPSVASINGIAAATTVTNGNSLSFTMPASLANAPPGSYPVIVTNPGGAASNILQFTFTQSLVLVTTILPGGTIGQGYGGTIVAAGGAPPYTFSATGLPPGLGINAQTGAIGGSPTQAGTFTPVFTVTDAAHSTVTGQISIAISGLPFRISLVGTLPDGVVGVGYSGTVGTSNGTSPITLSVASGTIPPGLSFLSSGLLTGVPTTIGTYTFTIQATDAAGATDTRVFTVKISPAPLTINGGTANPSGPAGTPLNINFGCAGGVVPYTYSVTGALPAGVTFANCILSGTPTVPGVYLIHITLTDSTGVSVTKDVTITVTIAPLTLAGGALPDGQVGVRYAASVRATGGFGTITYSAGAGLPDGLSMANTGDITGTPTKDGQFSFQVTATGQSPPTTAGAAAPPSVTATFTIRILPATLAFGPANLPDGQVGVAYTGSLSATGGVTPYAFTISGLPGGLSGNASGAITGTPTTAGTFTITAGVTDAREGSARQTYSIRIAPPALTFVTASAPNGTVGSAYSAAFNVTGGTGGYVFRVSGQPANFAMSANGVLSGNPGTPGTFTITVTVTDSSGATASKQYTFSIGLPSVPPLNFGGISTTITPLQQQRVSVSLASAFPVDVQVTLTISEQADSGPPDPAVVFAGGGNTTTITVPAGSLSGATDAAFQSGTVAGNIIFTATRITGAGTDLTPSPAPSRSIRIAPAAPVIVSMTAARTSSGITVTIVGYVTDREIASGNFGFVGNNLGTSSLTVPLGSTFSPYLGGGNPPSAQFGTQFTYTQTFLTTNPSAVTQISATLANNVGTSNQVTVNVN